MIFLVLPMWTEPDGCRTARHLPAAETMAEAQKLVERGLAMARQARGRDPVVVVADDMTGRTVARIKPKAVRA